MSRFDDRVASDLGHIADRATPSSTAWEAIQTRIDEQADQPEMEIIMLQPDPPRTRSVNTWMLGSAAAAVLVIAGAFFALRSDDDTSTLVATETSQAADPIPAADPGPPTTSSATAVGQPLPLTGRPLEAGVYKSDLPGLGFTFTWPETMPAFLSRPGEMLVVDDSPGQFRAFLMAAIGGWNTSAEAVDPSFHDTGSIDALDLDGWLAANDAVIVESREDIEIAGLPGVVADIRVDPTSSVGEGICDNTLRPCLHTWSLASQFDKSVRRGFRLEYQALTAGTINRVWFLPLPGADPVIFGASVGVNDDPKWLDEVGEIFIASLELNS